MTVIERYKSYRSGNQEGYSAIARAFGNSAIDNLINAHQEQKQDSHDNKEIEKAAAAAIKEVIERGLW